MKKVSRFEVIDANGRAIVYYGKISYSIQDNQQTLKVFTPDISIKDYISKD